MGEFGREAHLKADRAWGATGSDQGMPAPEYQPRGLLLPPLDSLLNFKSTSSSLGESPNFLIASGKAIADTPRGLS